MGYLWGASLWNVLIERAFYVIAWYTVFFIKMRACILPDDAIMIDLGFLFLFLLYEFTFLFTYFVATGCKEWSRSIHAERIIFLEMARESHQIGSWRYWYKTCWTTSKRCQFRRKPKDWKVYVIESFASSTSKSKFLYCQEGFTLGEFYL